MNTNDMQILIDWYGNAHRPLPWRKTRDPYAIWISEVMLQQTTTTAVLPYYEKFLLNFPNISVLAKTPLKKVYTYWAGLGYYSRARNLHKASQILNQAGQFPSSAKELQKIPGFGPYTARAVSSFAFQEKVGVLDGNVIRVLCRKNNLKVQWWKSKERQRLQDMADKFAQQGPSDTINQALMELGATICTPKNPHCIQCPWLKRCKSRKDGSTQLVPLPKPRRTKEIWLWQPLVKQYAKKIFLTKNDYTPFLSNQWFLPGRAVKLIRRPAHYDFCHSITHHEIYVQVKKKRVSLNPLANKLNEHGTWVTLTRLPQYAPASLIKKAVRHAQNDTKKNANNGKK